MERRGLHVGRRDVFLSRRLSLGKTYRLGFLRQSGVDRRRRARRAHRGVVSPRWEYVLKQLPFVTCEPVSPAGLARRTFCEDSALACEGLPEPHDR